MENMPFIYYEMMLKIQESHKVFAAFELSKESQSSNMLRKLVSYILLQLRKPELELLNFSAPWLPPNSKQCQAQR